MKSFWQLIETLDKDDVRHWANYAQKLSFSTEQEAREWIFRKLENNDRQFGKVFGIQGPSKNRQFANEMPLYKQGNRFKIGVRIRPKRWSWESAEIRPNTLEELETAGYVNMFDNPTLSKVIVVPIRKIYPTESHSQTTYGQTKAAELASMIKENYFKPIVLNEDYSVIDGHHRLEAAKKIGLKTIPAQIVSYKIHEVADPKKPIGPVKRKYVVKDRGTNVAKRVIQYHWTTSYGNKIFLQFEPRGDDSYFVMFYVNDTLYDAASRLGTQDKGVNRDSEILANVFYLLKKKADQLKAKELHFTAFKGERDIKLVRNLDVEPYKAQALKSLAYFTKAIGSYQVQMIPPSQSLLSLHKKLNKPEPQPQPDIDKKSWLIWAKRVGLSIRGNLQLDSLIDQLKTAKGNNRLPMIDLDQVIADLENLNMAVLSNTERGYEKNVNRRLKVYTRIVYKYFYPEWDVKISGTSFTLTRQ
jgi:hypothetical protein